MIELIITSTDFVGVEVTSVELRESGWKFCLIKMAELV